MLSKETALSRFQGIVVNNSTGSYLQKILGLRYILDNVLLEMFPDISEQGGYLACIDQIFEVKKLNGEYTPSLERKRQEFHKLRKYFNNIMHSKIEANAVGYINATRELSSLINFCSQIEIPAEVSAIFTCTNVKVPSTSSIRSSNKTIANTIRPQVEPPSVMPTLCLIVDRRPGLSDSQLLGIDNGIKTITKKVIKGKFNIVVFTIKRDSAVIAFPISGKKVQFPYSGDSENERIKPLRDCILNLNSDTQYHFLLTKATSECIFNPPVTLNDSSFLMTIGIVDNRFDAYLTDAQNNTTFDKLILESNLPSFFDWIVKIINNE